MVGASVGDPGSIGALLGETVGPRVGCSVGLCSQIQPYLMGRFKQPTLVFSSLQINSVPEIVAKHPSPSTVGMCVGWSVGPIDGSCVGTKLGESVGVPLGALVGLVLGAMVGDEVGVSVG